MLSPRHPLFYAPHPHSTRSPIPLAYTSRPVLHAAIPATARIHSDTLARHITPVPLAFAPTHSPAIALLSRSHTPRYRHSIRSPNIGTLICSRPLLYIPLILSHNIPLIL